MWWYTFICSVGLLKLSRSLLPWYWKMLYCSQMYAIKFLQKEKKKEISPTQKYCAIYPEQTYCNFNIKPLTRYMKYQCKCTGVQLYKVHKPLVTFHSWLSEPIPLVWREMRIVSAWSWSRGPVPDYSWWEDSSRLWSDCRPIVGRNIPISCYDWWLQCYNPLTQLVLHGSHLNTPLLLEVRESCVPGVWY